MSSIFLCSDVLYYIRVHAGLASLFCVLCSALDYFLKIWLYIFYCSNAHVHPLFSKNERPVTVVSKASLQAFPGAALPLWHPLSML